MRFSFFVKSSEIAVQESPRFSDFQTRCDAKYIVEGLCGLTNIGASQLNRAISSPGWGCGCISIASPVFISKRDSVPS